MADVNAEINISIDSSQAVSQLRSLQAQVTAFNQSLVAGNVAAARAQKDLLNNLATQINATKAFTTSMVDVETSAGRLGRAIDKNRLSLREYFRYGIAASGAMGKGMREHAEIMELAESRVKRLQTQYIGLTEAHNGYTRSMAIRPTSLFNADAAIGIQRQQLFNKLLHDGSTSLVNWGKNTQWAGRQLMVGFTVPLTIFGGIAGKIFMDLEKQIVQFKRVYGDLQTPTGEKSAMVQEIQDLGKEFTKYGIAVSDTVGLAAKAAATGATGADLLAATTEATRLATLGQIDYQQALDATISLQTAFRISSEDLADTTNFLNAVENQTVTSLDDITQAIPLVAPVIKGLGGDVKDLAIFMTAMREGGISANEGANALKSGLASLINPTKGAREQLEKVGINIDSILSKNKGDLRGLVTEFGQALGSLSKFERQQTLAKLFGKYQFARLGALFNNISKEGSQAGRVMDLTAMSAKELGQIAEGELGQLEEAVGTKFTAAVEKLKLAIAPVGEAFLKIATPIIDFATMIAEKFNELPDAAKTFITWGTAIAGVLVPTLIMVVGLLGNFAGNMLKIFAVFRGGLGKLRGAGSAFSYLAEEELDAMAASASLEGQTNSLTGSLNVQRKAVLALANAYGSYTAAAGATAANIPQGFRRPMRRMATGGFVAGTGNKDSEPALLMPGEFVVNKKAATENADILSAMNAGKLSKYAKGSEFTHIGRPMSIGVSSLEKILTEALTGTRAGGSIKAMAQVFGNEVKALLYPSLGFAASGSINNRMDKSVVSKEEFLQDWDSRDIKRWSTSVRRAGLKMSEVEDDLLLLDKAMRAQIASMKEGAIINDRVMEQIYENAQAQLPQNSKLRAGFGGLRSKYAEMRTNISQRAFAKFGIPTQTMGSKIAGRVGGMLIRSSERWGMHKAGGFSKGALTGAGAVELASTSERAGRAAAESVGEGAGTNSPSKITMQQGKDVAKGIEIGIEKGTPAVEDAGRKMGQAAVNGSQSALESNKQLMMDFGDEGLFPADPYRGERRLTREPSPRPTAADYDEAYLMNEQFNEQRLREQIVQRGSRVNPTGIDMDAASEQATQTVIDATGRTNPEDDKAKKTLKEKMNGMSGKLMGGMMAMDGLIFGLTMMEGSVGEFAQKIMPAAFALQGVSMMLPLLSNPLGIAIAAVAAVGAGFLYLAKQSRDMSVRSQEFADAMIASTDAMNGIAEVYGRESIVSRAAAKEKKAGYGVTKKQDEESSKFIDSELGKSMKSGLGTAIAQVGSSAAASQFANNLSSMVLQGVMGPKQAKALALAMGESLGNKTFGIKAAAELEEIIGPNGKDITKHPIKVALEIDKKNQQFIQSMGQSFSSQNIAGEMNSYGWNIEQDSMWGAAARGLRGLVDSEYRENTAQLEAAGAVIGNQMTQAYDNLSAAKERYKAISEAAEEVDKNDVNAKAEAEAASRRAKRQMDMLTKSIEDQKMAYLGMYRDLGQNGIDTSDAQGAMLRGMEQNILKQYESDPVMKAAWDSISGKVGALGGEVRFKVYAELESGGIDPMTMQNLIALYGDNAAVASEQYLALVYSVKGDSKLATSIVQGLMGNGLGEALTQELIVDVQLMNDDAAREYSELLIQTSQIEDESLRKTLAIEGTKKSAKELRQITEGVELYLGLPERLKKVVEVANPNSDEMQKIGKWYQKFKAEPDIEKTLFANDKFTAAFDAFGINYDTFNALPNINKALVMTYITAYMTLDKQYKDALALLDDKAALDAAAGGEVGIPTGAVKSQAMTVARIKAKRDAAAAAAEAALIPVKEEKGGKKKPTPVAEPPGGGSDGGGSREKTWLEEKIEELKANSRLYNTASKWVNVLKKERGMFFGRLQQLRTGTRVVKGGEVKSGYARIPEQLIAEIGAGPEGQKRMQELLGLSKKAFNNFIQRYRDELLGRTVERMRAETYSKNRSNKAKGILEGAIPGLTETQKSNFKFTNEELDKLMSDPEWVESFHAAMKKSKRYQNEFLTWTKKWLKALEDSNDETDFDKWMNQLEQLNTLMEQAYDAEEAKVATKYANDFKTAHGMTVEEMEKQIEANERLIDIQEDIVDGKQEEIDDIQHTNDMIQQRIDDLRREDELRNRIADQLQRDLDMMQKAEEKINAAYDERIAALDKTARINDYIINQQRRQIGLAQALSEGDVYAAAEAANEMQAAQADFATEQSRTALENQRQAALDALTNAQGLTRKMIEDQIAAIKEQSYQTSLKIRVEEDKIYTNNLEVRRLSNEIYDIRESQIEPLQNANELYSRAIDYHKTDLEYAIASVKIAGLTRAEWEKKNNEMMQTINNAKNLHPDLLAIANDYAAIAARINEAADAAKRLVSYGGEPIAGLTATTAVPTASSAPSNVYYAPNGVGYANDPTAPYYSTSPTGAPIFNYGARRFAGGKIKKFAAGSIVGDGRRDSVPAMLTPGEYVIRRSMVEKYGTPFFDSLNMGSFQMPRFRSPERVGMPNTSSAPRQNNSASVYNNSYSVNVNASGTNASPDQIANVVISKIRAIEQMSVRG